MDAKTVKISTAAIEIQHGYSAIAHSVIMPGITDYKDALRKTVPNLADNERGAFIVEVTTNQI